MTVLIDASAIVAIATNEPEAVGLVDAVREETSRLCCSTGIWEATLAIARKRTVSVRDAAHAIDRLFADLGVTVVPVGEAEARLAVDAHARYGKGSGHPARLNMGDCFAYASAKANGARLIYKGDDFAMTDLQA